MCIVASRERRSCNLNQVVVSKISGVSEIKIEIKATSNELWWIFVNTGVIPDKVYICQNF